jgi:CHAT domain-containing protein/Tfp pilus assembly protein PilF
MASLFALLKEATGSEQTPQSGCSRALTLLLAMCLFAPCCLSGPADEHSPEERKELERAKKIHSQAVQLYQKGQYVEAVKLLKQSLEINEKLYPKARFPHGHPDLAGNLNDLGELLKVQGEYAKALPCLQRALAMRQALYPKDKYPHGHPELADSLGNLATLLQAQGEYAQALPYYQRALEMDEALYPKDKFPRGHFDLGIRLNNLATLLQAQGEYPKALPYFQRALEMFESLYPKTKFPDGHPYLAGSLNNLAALLSAQGEYGKALPYCQRALEMRETLYPKAGYPAGHPELANSWNNLGELRRLQGEYDKALPCLRRAVEMYEALYPKAMYPRGHPELASSLNNLGMFLHERGEYAKAVPYCQRALAMREALYPKTIFPNGHPDLALSLNNLAEVLQVQGEYTKALSHCQQAVKMYEALYPPTRYPQGHPHLARSLTNLGDLLHVQGKYRQALLSLKRGVRMEQELANTFASAVSETEALNYAAALPLTSDNLLSTSRHPSVVDFDAYLLVWRSRAALMRILQGKQYLRASAVEGASKTWDDLQRVRRQLARLVLAPSRGDKEQEKRLQELTEQKEELERQLAKAVPAFARQQQLEGLGPADLVKHLPAHTAFIDLIQYIYLEYDPKKPGRPGEKRTASYVAFVLLPGQSPHRVELGTTQPVQTAVDQWRKDLAANKSSKAAEVLRTLVWEPIAKQLPAGTQTVYLAPDGDLTRIPWGALPGKKKDSVLLEEYALALVPHGPFLLDQLTANPAKDKDPGLLLAVGDVNYDQKPKALVKDEVSVNRSPEVGDKVVSWPRLPGTLKELEQVLQLAGKRPVVRRSGTEASTDQLLADLTDAKKVPRYVHLATHGFFADPKFRSILQVDADLFKYRGFQDRARPGDRNPLVLSGIVLAGANLPPPKDVQALLHDDRGILTAETIAGLPLRQLELVVLSACETGLGEVAGHEGIYGLQRAFHLAGAKNVVASLWKIDDEATAALMGLFYHKLWQEKQPTLQALRQAQLFLYRHPELVGALAKARGPKDLGKIVSLPPDPKQPPVVGQAPAKLWAAFVLSGAGQ